MSLSFNATVFSDHINIWVLIDQSMTSSGGCLSVVVFTVCCFIGFLPCIRVKLIFSASGVYPDIVVVDCV